MDLEQPVIRISVRNLVEFILRSGDIDNRTGGSDKDAMQQGGRMHRKIQKSMGADYHAEVVLTSCQNLYLCIRHRLCAMRLFMQSKGIWMRMECR